MKELLIIAIGSAIVNNVVLSQFLGICPFLGVSKKVETATGMGGAVVFVITLSSFFTGLIYKFILVPLGFEYQTTSTLSRLSNFFKISSFSSLFFHTMYSPTLHSLLGILCFRIRRMMHSLYRILWLGNLLAFLCCAFLKLVHTCN